MRWNAAAAALLALGMVQSGTAQEAEDQEQTPGYMTETSSPAPPRTSMIPLDRPVLELSLAEAIQLTLSKSLGTRVRAVDRVIAVAALEGAKSGYDAALASDLDASGTQRSTTSGLESDSGQFVAKDITLDTSLSQALPIGGSAQVRLSTQRSDSNSSFNLLPADYSSSLTASISYPLLRDRGNRSLNTPIKRAENNVELSDLGFRQEVIDAVFRTQGDYLDVILAKENLKVQEQSLALAKNLLEIAQAQERVGTLAPIEVLSAESGVAAREEGIIVAESAVLAAEDVLRTSLNLPENLDMWNVAIVPTDTPGFPEEEYDFDEAVAKALEMRPDYQQALINMKTQRLEIELSRDRLRPQFDVGGAFGIVGNSQVGVVLDPNGVPGGGPQGSIFGSHLEDMLSFDNFTWGVGFTLRQSLGNRAASSAHRIDKLELERSLLELRNLELIIVSQVRGFLRRIETDRKRVAASMVAAELAKRRLEAEEKKFQVGTATSFNVLQFQEEYVRAATSYSQSVIDVNRAVLSLQQALGMTLQANGIRIEDGEAILGAP